MKGFKKVLSVILCIVILFSSAPLAGFVGLELPSTIDFFGIKAKAATSGTCGENLTWSYDENTRVLKISGAGPMTDYGTSDAPWHSYYNYVRTIDIGDEVTTIGSGAFFCFYGITSVTIPDNITSIGRNSFYYCYNLTNISIGEGVIFIGEHAFNACYSLKSITIPCNVSTIENEAFSGCSALIEFKVNPDNQYFSNDNYGVLFSKDKTQLIQYPAGNKRTSYEVPTGVVTICDDAFSNCDNLVSVIVSEGVTSIGWSVFSNCENLTNISLPVSLKSIGLIAFIYSRKLTNVYYSGDISDWLKISFYEGFKGESNPMRIARNFYSKGNLVTNLVIPEGIAYIDSYAFYNWDCIETVSLPDSLTTIGGYSFSYCDNLKSVTFFDNVTTIYSNAFYESKNIENVYYYGSKNDWNKISIGSNNKNLLNSKIHYIGPENQSIINEINERFAYENIIICVKAVDETTNNLVDVIDATVEVKLNGKTILSRKSNDNGIVEISKEDFLNKKFLISDIVKSATVEAYKEVGDELYICNFETFHLNSQNRNLILGRIQYRPSLSVAYNARDISSHVVESTLNKFVNDFYNLTSGRVKISISEICECNSIDVDTNVDDVVSKSDCNILIFRNHKNQTDNVVYPQKGHIYMGIENSNGGLTSELLCHEAMHYLFGVKDEYCCGYRIVNDSYHINFNGDKDFWGREKYDSSDIGYNIYWARSEEYELPNSYELEMNEYVLLKVPQFEELLSIRNISLYTDDEKTNINGKIYYSYSVIETDGVNTVNLGHISEYHGAYFGHGIIDSPKNIDTFGLMDNNTLTLSTDEKYNYLNNYSSTAKDVINSNNPQWYTAQYFANGMSVSDQITYSLRSKISDSCPYVFTASSNIDYIHSKSQINIPFNITTLNDAMEYDENTELLSKASISYDKIFNVVFQKNNNSTLVNLESNNITKTIILVKFADNPSYARFDLSFINGSASVEIPNSSGFIEKLYTIALKDSAYIYNIYYFESFGNELNDGTYPTSYLTVSSENDFKEDIVIFSESNQYTNDEYISVTTPFSVVSISDTEVYTNFSQTVPFMEGINFSSIQAFKYDGETFTEIDTSVGTGESNLLYVYFPYSGEGRYVVMAKPSAKTIYEAPINLLVDDVNSIHDKEIHISFDDPNSFDSVANYILYYSTTEIVDTHAEGVKCVSLSPGRDKYTLYLDDDYGKYYFYVEVLGVDGGKSPLSEPDCFSLAPYDDDADGIPDYWLNWYPSLLELKDISGTDSDNDGLTNLQEYECGTDPLNPDTDGDNVFDGIELKKCFNPLNVMSDSVTDDYILIFGVSDVLIDKSSFIITDTSVTCTIANKSDGLAMRTVINLYINDELIESNIVNLDSNSSVNYTFSRDYFVDGLKIILDEDRITRDTDYSNNKFEYISASSITATNTELTMLSGSKFKLKYELTPNNATNVLIWDSSDINIVSVDSKGFAQAVSEGSAVITATTPSGVICSYNISVQSADKAQIVISPPDTRTINYGESIKLYANTSNIPNGYKIKWSVDGDGVKIEPSVTGQICTVTSTSTGNVVIKAYIVDSNGNIVTDQNGKQVSDSEYFYSEANLWLRIVYFFKKLFGISVTTAQLFKDVI